MGLVGWLVVWLVAWLGACGTGRRPVIRLDGPGTHGTDRQVGEAEEDGACAAGGGELAGAVGVGLGRGVGRRRGCGVALVEDFGECCNGLGEARDSAETRACRGGGVGEGQELVAGVGGEEEGELLEGEVEGSGRVVEGEVRVLEDFQGAGDLLWRERGVDGDGDGGDHEYG